MNNWKYYNHAAVPLCAPHETPDLMPIENGEIWKMPGSPMFARWTTGFDCEKKSNWWYVVRFGPFSMEELSRSSRKHIRQALKKCSVRRINVSEHLEALFAVFDAAHEKYEHADNRMSFSQFRSGCIGSEQNGTVYWGGFCAETGRLIGYMTVSEYGDYGEIRTAKFDPAYLNLLVSDALYATVLEYYLNDRGLRYLSSGTRSINHVTNTEEYKIRHFGYQRAYCRLHLYYNPKYRLLIRMIYPLRKILLKFDGIGPIHRVNAVMKMEEIARNDVD